MKDPLGGKYDREVLAAWDALDDVLDAAEEWYLSGACQGITGPAGGAAIKITNDLIDAIAKGLGAQREIPGSEWKDDPDCIDPDFLNQLLAFRRDILTGAGKTPRKAKKKARAKRPRA